MLKDKNVKLLTRAKLLTLPVPDTASYIRGWMQMVLTPNDLFSWNNKYSEYRLYYYITLQWIHCQLSSSARWLTLCMLVSSSREGVVFLVFLPSSHFTEFHVLPPPVSEANWRSLSRPGVSPPPSSSNMASSFTGSAHSPFPGYDTLPGGKKCWQNHWIAKNNFPIFPS